MLTFLVRCTHVCGDDDDDDDDEDDDEDVQ